MNERQRAVDNVVASKHDVTERLGRLLGRLGELIAVGAFALCVKVL
ncbi:MAG: hypothetical protein GY716_19215 [bacterium]|nr:hypothetical protein [bacterium]